MIVFKVQFGKVLEYEKVEEDQKQNKTIPDLLVATVCHRIKRKTRIRGASL